jgi:hypothetical protein
MLRMNILELELNPGQLLDQPYKRHIQIFSSKGNLFAIVVTDNYKTYVKSSGSVELSPNDTLEYAQALTEAARLALLIQADEDLHDHLPPDVWEKQRS